jgi:predicted nucleic acid-binding protein
LGFGSGDGDGVDAVECAVAGKVSLIVTGDRHLRRLKSFEGIGIVNPRDFLRIGRM